MRLNWIVVLAGLMLFTNCGGGGRPPEALNPVPKLLSLSPASAVEFGPALTMMVSGTDFSLSSTVQFDGSSRPATFVSSTLIQVPISVADLAGPATIQVTVSNPPPGGGASQTLPFAIDQPGPGVLRQVTIANDNSPSNNDSVLAAVSDNGRFVAFDSNATNLVSNDVNGYVDVFLRDTCLGATTPCSSSTVRVSVATDGTEGNLSSSFPSISSDGRYVAFSSSSSNLVTEDTDHNWDVFVRDTCFGATGCTPSTFIVSLASDGTKGNYSSGDPHITKDGRYVFFDSGASNLVPNDNNFEDIFVRDTCTGVHSGCTPSTIDLCINNAIQ